MPLRSLLSVPYPAYGKKQEEIYIVNYFLVRDTVVFSP